MNRERRSGIKIRVENTDFEVTGGEFQQLLAAVKALPGRRFVSAQKLWTVTGSVALVRGQIENSGFKLEGGTPVSAVDAAQTAPSNDRIRISVEEQPMVVTGGAFQTMLAAIKEIQGRRFDGQTKQWTLPGSISEIKAYFDEKGMQVENAEKPPQPAKKGQGQTLPPETPPVPNEIPFLSEEETAFNEDIF